jgi:short subunit dehydrogenase-like uncharacterized protein
VGELVKTKLGYFLTTDNADKMGTVLRIVDACGFDFLNTDCGDMI